MCFVPLDLNVPLRFASINIEGLGERKPIVSLGAGRYVLNTKKIQVTSAIS